MDPIPLLDLFSGIGGFSLGLERSGAFRTVAFCEIDPFCRRVLQKHWPGIRCYDDIRLLTAERLAKDGIEVGAICGGFPCQDISLSGPGGGLSGERSGLWFEFARLIGELRPRVVFVENVAELLGRVMGDVLGTLATLGYDAEWHCISAASIGAPHERERIWIIAYPNETQFQGGGISGRIYTEHANARNPCWGKDKPGLERTSDGVPYRVDRVGALGNAVVPQIPELLGRAYAASVLEVA